MAEKRMRRDHVADEVGRQLAAQLADTGFAWERKRGYLARTRVATPGGEVLHRLMPLPVQLQGADFWSLDLKVALRYERIAPLVGRHLGLPPERLADLPTVSRDLVNLYTRDVPLEHWRFRHLGDIVDQAPRIADRVRQLALPFLERLSTVDGLVAFIEKPGEWAMADEMRAYLLLALYAERGEADRVRDEAIRRRGGVRNPRGGPEELAARWRTFLDELAAAYPAIAEAARAARDAQG
jgi:hypothetical protein